MANETIKRLQIKSDQDELDDLDQQELDSPSSRTQLAPQSSQTTISIWNALSIGANVIGFKSASHTYAIHFKQSLFEGLCASMLPLIFSYNESMAKGIAFKKALAIMHGEEEALEYARFFAVRDALRNAIISFPMNVLFQTMIAYTILFSRPNATQLDFEAKPDYSSDEINSAMLTFIGGMGMIHFILNRLLCSHEEGILESAWNAFKMGSSYFILYLTNCFDSVNVSAATVTAFRFAANIISSQIISSEPDNQEQEIIEISTENVAEEDNAMQQVSQSSDRSRSINI